jgi:hypothetical protein
MTRLFLAGIRIPIFLRYTCHLKNLIRSLQNPKSAIKGIKYHEKPLKAGPEFNMSPHMLTEVKAMVVRTTVRIIPFFI